MTTLHTVQTVATATVQTLPIAVLTLTIGKKTKLTRMESRIQTLPLNKDSMEYQSQTTIHVYQNMPVLGTKGCWIYSRPRHTNGLKKALGFLKIMQIMYAPVPMR